MNKEKKASVKVDFADNQSKDTLYCEIGKWVYSEQYTEREVRSKLKFLYRKLKIDRSIFNLDNLIYLIDTPSTYDDVVKVRRNPKKYIMVSLYLNVKPKVLAEDAHFARVKTHGKDSDFHRSFHSMIELGKEFSKLIDSCFPYKDTYK